MIWVTGAAGSIGAAVLDQVGGVGTDLEVDVTDPEAVAAFVVEHQPDLVFHCAGAKHAPEGEADPQRISEINIGGTANILDHVTGRVVLASTCKAADPETVYGASKLIAERMVLNAGGTVARFYNVIETQGNVFDIWAGADMLAVMPCWRYFMHLDQAVELMVACASLPTGRYTVDPGPAVYLPRLADELYPDKEKRMARPRRGDRVREPSKARSEMLSDLGWWMQITSPHDP